MAKAGPKDTTRFLNLDDPDELTRRPIRSFHNLEAELTNLCRADHHTAEETAAKAEARIAEAEVHIKEICSLANSTEPDFGERFVGLLRKRWRSSADMVEYLHKRDRLLLLLREAFPAAEERRRQRAVFTSNRDEQMAEEFRKKRNSPANKRRSDSDLMIEIGKLRGIKRSAAIAAIRRRLKSPPKA